VPPPPATVAPPPPRAPAPAAAPDAEALYRNTSERLKALQKLRDTGVITEQEYQEKRREILKAL
jgi:mannose-1-phosphate guanylyltransferase